MLPIRDLQEQLLHREAPLVPDADPGSQQRLIVLRHYRFHKKLSIELYTAPLSKEGKWKNPLTAIDPLEAVLQATDPEELRFYAAVSRFQNNPTALPGPADLEALQVAWHHPPGWVVCRHDPEFSEKVVAGSLQRIQRGATLHDLTLLVEQSEGVFSVRPQLTIGAAILSWAAVSMQYGYFLQAGSDFHLPASYHLLKALRFFAQYPAGMRLRPADFASFQQEVLTVLEEHLSVVYTYAQRIAPEAALQLGLYTPPERLLYLSDLGPYVCLTPVMKYGAAEVPVRSRRAVYARDAKGGMYQLQRDAHEESNFIALLLRQHPHFPGQLEGELPYFYLHRKRFLEGDWFPEAFAQWQAEGIAVLGFSELKGNKLDPHRAAITVHVRSGINWFNAEVGVRFGKKKASLTQVERALRNRSRYVALGDGTFGVLPEEWIKRLEEWFHAAELTGDELRVPKTGFKTLKQLFAEEDMG